MGQLDRRLNAYREDLADAALRGRVEAARFVEGEPGRVAAAVADIRPAPDRSAGIDTQALRGEAVTIFDTRDGWSWVQLRTDGYVGYVPAEAISHGAGSPTHVVSALRTFVYSAPDLKTPVSACMSIGSRLTVVDETTTRGTRYAMLDGSGAVIAAHLSPSGAMQERDYVAIVARFLETPYLWGGRSAFGIDCSGLVQLAMGMAGREAPRDSDMQAATLGTGIDESDLRRGDLIFWRGHVAILEDSATVLHANGQTMTVAREALAEALERIAPIYGRPIAFRRP